MPLYYVIEASFGPRVEQTGLRYGPIEASDPENAIHKTRHETQGYGHLRVEVFSNEQSYKKREQPITAWEDTDSLRSLVSSLVKSKSIRTRERFEAFFVTPLPS